MMILYVPLWNLRLQNIVVGKQNAQKKCMRVLKKKRIVQLGRTLASQVQILFPLPKHEKNEKKFIFNLTLLPGNEIIVVKDERIL